MQALSSAALCAPRCDPATDPGGRMDPYLWRARNSVARLPPVVSVAAPCVLPLPRAAWSRQRFVVRELCCASRWPPLRSLLWWVWVRRQRRFPPGPIPIRPLTTSLATRHGHTFQDADPDASPIQRRVGRVTCEDAHDFARHAVFGLTKIGATPSVSLHLVASARSPHHP